METAKHCEALEEPLYVNTLSNGIKCYIIPRNNYVEKHVAICVNYGSIDTKYMKGAKLIETPTGTAHFLEHKLFEQRDGLVITDEFAKLGGSVNAFTNFTNTAYHFTTMERFDKNLALLLKFVTEPYFTEENVRKERGIIAQEINMYRDDPFWRMYFNLLRALYRTCPIREDIAGTVESIERITSDMLYACYESFYLPRNMALICVGEIDRETVYAAASHFPHARQDITSCRRPLSASGAVSQDEEPEGVALAYYEERMPLARPMFSIGFKGRTRPEDAADTIIAARVLMDIIAGESSEFFNRIYSAGHLDSPFGLEYLCGPSRENSPLNYSAAIFSGSAEDPRHVLQLLTDEVLRLGRQGIDRQRFEQIKRKHYGRFLRGFNTIGNIGAGMVDLFSKELDYFELAKSYEKLTLDSVTESMSALMNPLRLACSVVLPV
ncbi:MAG: insulinase family protein [Clostridiales bacterium]|jgi:predicted Zn-dependent peptidase|nr:insulinase family protein [Clostridiales bacterium]